MAWTSDTLCDEVHEIIHTPEYTFDLVEVAVFCDTVSALIESSGRGLCVAIHFHANGRGEPLVLMSEHSPFFLLVYIIF
ncbi:MAG TPA: hypothetical protein VN429_06310 [Methanospirillum sp.]|nr:hypothetical protein [Methanospirillum sp.]